jgi:hypothetical protein
LRPAIAKSNREPQIQNPKSKIQNGLLLSFEERLQSTRSRRVSQLTQSLRFDLPDAFASNGEVLSDLFKRVLGAGVPKTESHLDHFLFTRRKRRKNLVSDLSKIREGY